ncbi:MAG: stage V sporulation T C-terminal domain-containing protein [Bacillota bacterium]|jgi:AbrB family transcriptional regulator (stage V sporulation protein T)
MKATGIVRRIDDLGRVVIPKEIRRTMRIHEGDPLEIYVTAEEKIILKKYSPLGELSKIADEYAQSISENLDKTVMITDRDHIIAVSGKAKKDFLGQPIGRLVKKSMQERRLFCENYDKPTSGTIINEENGEQLSENNHFYGKIIAPIINHGDPMGAVIIVNKDQKIHLGILESKIAETAASFFARYLEH